MMSEKTMEQKYEESMRLIEEESKKPKIQREVLIEYEMTQNINIPKSEWSYFTNTLKAVSEKVDRYLAEKQSKTEKK